MTAVTEAARHHPELPDTIELAALTAVAVYKGHSYPLKLVSLRGDVLTAEAITNNVMRNGSSCEIEFRLREAKWLRPATLSRTTQSTTIFELSGSGRPPADSRIAKRWRTNRLHPIAGRVQNHLCAGQWFHCAVDNISIGGARLIVAMSSNFAQSQIGLVEIHYPLQTSRSTQSFQITGISEVNNEQHLHVRFSPITNSHIRSIARHLIEFGWHSPISEIELDLSSTDWPKHRIRTRLTRQGDKVEVEASVLGEVICSLTSAVQGSTLRIENTALDARWDEGEQLQSLIAPLIEDLKNRPQLNKIQAAKRHSALGQLSFRKTADDHWVYELNETSTPETLSANDKGSQGTVYASSNTPRENDISWDDYGLVYDKMCEVNSSYQALVDGYSQWLKTKEGSVEKAVDIGAGTGNFVLKAAGQLSTADVAHVDQDIVMNLFAQEKYFSANIRNVSIKTCSAESASFRESSLDLVTAIHSLYTLPDPLETLSRIFTWLKSGGYLYVVDIGRTIDTNEWSRHIFLETTKDRGFLSTVRYFWEARDAISQNKKIQANQSHGKYWMKSHSEFVDALKNIGFIIEKSEITYRGNSDLAICRKP